MHTITRFLSLLLSSTSVYLGPKSNSGPSIVPDHPEPVPIDAFPPGLTLSTNPPPKEKDICCKTGVRAPGLRNETREGQAPINQWSGFIQAPHTQAFQCKLFGLAQRKEYCNVALRNINFHNLVQYFASYHTVSRSQRVVNLSQWPNYSLIPGSLFIVHVCLVQSLIVD